MFCLDNENEKRVYCTNMNEKDPIIEKFMKEYLKQNLKEKEQH